ncbi:MAG: tRNA (N6-threonylcarbamoyladenosine(37)-N6)-methyltransferase TrmO [Ignavibacteriaceae bacterium]|nr:tRNA (N6-threonylcarbamoyladenosine(37)-N6)-methyltransferase TrmO [Ignavibacteriaceae bacterium]
MPEAFFRRRGISCYLYPFFGLFLLNMIDDIIIKPIGIVHSERVHRYETPRQGVLAGGDISVIRLSPNFNFEQAVKDLEGFERIWVIYQFHLNKNWKPMVTPPRHTRRKVGVFATRAPHRPNQIGMSCVKLESIKGLEIFISESDILDGSPVLDIKPYLPYSDSFPGAATGWVKGGLENIYVVEFESKAEEQCLWLKNEAGINLVNFARLQLEFNPVDDSRKRISAVENKGRKKGMFILAYRTWRIIYHVNAKGRKVLIKEIRSGYTDAELKDAGEDLYKDKALHRKFIKQYFNME